MKQSCKAVFLSATLSFLLFCSAFAQDDKIPLSERFYFGGNVAIQGGSGYTYLELSPLVGYRLTERWSVGTSPTYMHVKREDVFFGKTVTNKISAMGNRLFTRYNIGLDDLLQLGGGAVFLHSEHEALRYSFKTDANEATTSKWYQSVFVGGGFSQPLGRRGALNLTVLYNLLYDQQSLYNSPIVYRVGFTF